MCSFSDIHQMPSKTRLIITVNEEEEIINPLRFGDQVQALCFLSCSHTDVGIVQTSGGDITWTPPQTLATRLNSPWMARMSRELGTERIWLSPSRLNAQNSLERQIMFFLV